MPVISHKLKKKTTIGKTTSSDYSKITFCIIRCEITGIPFLKTQMREKTSYIIRCKTVKKLLYNTQSSEKIWRFIGYKTAKYSLCPSTNYWFRSRKGWF